MRPQSSLLELFAVVLLISGALAGPAPAAGPTPYPRILGILPGEAAGDFYGNAIAECDFDGDGIHDLVAAACGSDAHGTETGRVYIHRGTDKGPTRTPMRIMTGEHGGDVFGFALATGDMNADGWDDVAVGAPQNDAAGADAGRVYVFWGGPLGDGTAGLTLTGEAAGDRFGVALACCDLDGDGDADLVIGACGHDSNGLDSGRAYLFDGGPGIDSISDHTWDGTAPGDRFGGSVGWLGDATGDGRADVGIGADGADSEGEGVDVGAVRVIANRTEVATLWGEEPDSGFGMVLAGAGDVNGDGNSDLVIGASRHSGGGPDAGRVTCFFGGPSFDAISDLWLDGLPGDRLGTSLAALGDFDGDGFPDIGAGAPGAMRGGLEVGGVRVLFGGSLTPWTRTLEVVGRQAGADFGSSVGPVGSGRLAVGAWYADDFGNDAGRVHVFELAVPVWPYGRARIAAGEESATGGEVGAARIIDACGRVHGRIEAGADAAVVLHRLPAGLYFVVTDARSRGPARRVVVVR